MEEIRTTIEKINYKCSNCDFTSEDKVIMWRHEAVCRCKHEKVYYLLEISGWDCGCIDIQKKCRNCEVVIGEVAIKGGTFSQEQLKTAYEDEAKD